MTVATTARLVLRTPAGRDADFIRRLVNDADWLRYIGDRHVHTLADAGAYIRTQQDMNAEHGVGLHIVEVDGVPTGLCGLLVRPERPHVDLGFALLPEHRGAGYASEAARAVLARAFDGPTTRVDALVSPGNHASEAVLARLGFQRIGTETLGDDSVHVFTLRPADLLSLPLPD